MENQQQDAQRRALEAQSSNDTPTTGTAPDADKDISAPGTAAEHTSADTAKPAAAQGNASSNAAASATSSASTAGASTSGSSTSGASASRTETSAPVSRSSSWSMRLAVLLSLSMGGAALAGGYYLYQQLIVQFHHTKALEENAAVSLKEPVARINQLEQRQQQIAQLEAELGRLTTDQIALERRLANLAQKTPDDWLIAEADYLVRMAGRKLWLEQDPATALSLLKAADERIAAMQDTALLPLRKALAADIVQVGAIRSIDIASNVYALDEIMLQLDALKPGRSQNSYQPVRDENLSSSIDDWQSNLAKSWKALVNDFVTVRHRASDITPLLSPQQEWYLKENIRAKLLQAQLALYRHDEASFGEAITMANGWVKQYFSLEQGSGGSISSHLDKLSALRIDAVPVSKFRASDLLRALLQDGVLQDGVMQDAQTEQQVPAAETLNPNEPSPNERNPDESGAEAPTPAEQESSEPDPVTQEPGEQEPGNQEPGLTPQPSAEANAASQEMRL